MYIFIQAYVHIPALFCLSSYFFLCSSLDRLFNYSREILFDS